MIRRVELRDSKTIADIYNEYLRFASEDYR